VALRLVLGQDRIRPWLRGGIHTHLVEGRIQDPGSGVLDIRSESGAGYEVGGGVLIAVGQRASLSPGFRYGFGDVPFKGRPDLGLRYLMADLGLVLGF
jgi:opacity protein-like surface antigen